MIFGGHILFSAESEGFEPPVQLPVHRISSAAHSTTLAAFLRSSFASTNVGKFKFVVPSKAFFSNKKGTLLKECPSLLTNLRII